jgi:hypothetical protein
MLREGERWAPPRSQGTGGWSLLDRAHLRRGAERIHHRRVGRVWLQVGPGAVPDHPDYSERDNAPATAVAHERRSPSDRAEGSSAVTI